MITLADIVKKWHSEILTEWLKRQLEAEGMRRDLIKEDELKGQSEDFLTRFEQALQSGSVENTKTPAWDSVRTLVTELTRQRGKMGFTPSETAIFVFSLKPTLYSRLSSELKSTPDKLVAETATVNDLLDGLALSVMEAYQQTREEVIMRQQEEMLELSTPVVKLWDGIVALPLIGTLDSARTSVVMESLLQRIVETGSDIAIIDITGVPTVDTLVAQHLLKTVAAARLMGADCIISGIRPQIAQTMVHLAIDLSSVITKATIAEALKVALQRSGYRFVKEGEKGPAPKA